MGSALSPEEDGLLQRALRAASDTKFLMVEGGARHTTARLFQSAFGESPAVIVADNRTYAAAGAEVRESLCRAGIPCGEPFLFPDEVYAEHTYVEMLQSSLSPAQGIPVAVGSGTINDLTKLVAHRLGRQYMAVATAASMDGYTAYGASITYRGSKQTFDCPAPLAVLADLEVVVRAPREMNAAGYADLLAKGVAGADWILADAALEESIQPAVWSTVQDRLPSWVDSPSAIARAEPEGLRRLTVGLMMTGFAMQAMRSSRPASGADHQFSHLWDMQHHTYHGTAPSHGFKVGVGTRASLELYNVLLRQNLNQLSIDDIVARWPAFPEIESRIAALFGRGELADKALEETRAKHPTPIALRAQLLRLRDVWPELRERLASHLQSFQEARTMLEAAGSPAEPEQIGISRQRLRQSYEQAYYIRRRFTVLDLAMRLKMFESSMNELFGTGGIWAMEGEAAC